jgi:putative membrane protein insertion efficiency factor
VLLVVLRGYKILLSPLFAGSCRFTPSCADYMSEAIRVHGAVSGLRLGLRRLGRCRPWGPWGFDPVPGNHPPAGFVDTNGRDSTAHQVTDFEHGPSDKTRRAPRLAGQCGAKVQ